MVYFYGSKEQKQNSRQNRFFVRAHRHSLVCVLLRRVVKTKTKSFSETIVKRARHVVGETLQNLLSYVAKVSGKYSAL